MVKRITGLAFCALLCGAPLLNTNDFSDLINTATQLGTQMIDAALDNLKAMDPCALIKNTELTSNGDSAAIEVLLLALIIHELYG